MATQTNLSKKMLRRADADQLPLDHPLRQLAAEFDAATDGAYATPPTCDMKMFMRAWARARQAWCKYSCEALV